jgi:DNA-binding CsgD family transcriptional regulator/PAS domain-containing protein
MAFDPDVLLPNGYAATRERSLDEAVVACRNEQLDRDRLKFRSLAVASRRVGVASRETDLWTRSSPRWQQILDMRGHAHELRAALVDGAGQCWGAVSLQRESRRPFTAREVRLLEGALEGHASAIARSMVAGRVPQARAEPGAVWLDDAGRVVFASPAAQRWLDFLDAGRTVDFSRTLLAGLAIRVNASRGGRRGQPGGSPEASAIVRTRAASGHWVRLTGEPVAQADGTLRGISVVIDAARAGDVLPIAARAFQLTGRELEVVRGVLNGLATRSLAASLRISEYTVQDHLKSVFTKTGVGTRRELAHLLAVQFG